MTPLLLLVALGVVLRTWHRRCARPLHLVADEHGNEMLVVDAWLGGVRTLFMVDTAYAGAPVLSTSFLSVQTECQKGTTDVAARARRCLRALRSGVAEDERQEAVSEALLRRTQCRSFTSGCTMKLMGIGTTVETQADMLLCPSIRIDGRADVDVVPADVVVSNPLPGSFNILTMDYLLHRAPVTLLPRKGRLLLHDVFGAHAFAHVDAEMVGGSFVVPMAVGGTELRVVLDTGAAACLSLSADAAKRVATSRPPEATHLVQVGVNGERVCSDVTTARVVVASAVDLGEVAVLVNDTPVQGADGYAGMGLLRALDMRFVLGRVGFRPSGLAPRSPAATSRGSCREAFG